LFLVLNLTTTFFQGLRQKLRRDFWPR